MLRGLARWTGIAAALVSVAVALAATPAANAQTSPPPGVPAGPAPVPPAAAGNPQTSPAPSPQPSPEAKPSQPAQITPEGIETKPGDPFGEELTLAAKPIIYIKGSGTWDDAFATISGALKKVEAYAAAAGLKADGLPMTIFLSTDDRGFDYEAALPLAEPAKDPPHGDILAGESPAGRALKFVHRGSYDSLDDTYEAITNYLDDKRLESKNVLIEQYVTDPVTADAKNLVINVLVLVN
jgi:effector-binding domain-containing protein